MFRNSRQVLYRGDATMNVTKSEVMAILEHHPNKWLPTKKVASSLNVATTPGINRVANVLYRLRHFPQIERRSTSHAYQYRFRGDIEGHTTILPRVSKPKAKKSDLGEYTFIDKLIEESEGYCEECDNFCPITFHAKKSGRVVCLCEKHGEKVNVSLGNYGGVWQ